MLFGGYDTEKYTGPIVSFPVAPIPTEVEPRLAVTWNGISATYNGSVRSLSSSRPRYPAVFDSGAQATRLPPDIYNNVLQFFGALHIISALPIVDCDWSTRNGTLDYTFGTSPGVITISVPFSELVIPRKDGICELWVAPETLIDGFYLFGDNFMRSAYIVFDYDKNQISMAQADWNSKSSNIIEIQ